MATFEKRAEGTTSTGIGQQVSFAEADDRYLSLGIIVNFAVFLELDAREDAMRR